VDFKLGSRPRRVLAFFLGVARASDENVHVSKYRHSTLYFVCMRKRFCGSQNNRITWQKEPTFSFKNVLSVIVTISKFWVRLWSYRTEYCCVWQPTNNIVTKECAVFQITYLIAVANLGVLPVFNELSCSVISMRHRSLSLMLPCAWI